MAMFVAKCFPAAAQLSSERLNNMHTIRVFLDAEVRLFARLRVQYTLMHRELLHICITVWTVEDLQSAGCVYEVRDMRCTVLVLYCIEASICTVHLPLALAALSASMSIIYRSARTCTRTNYGTQ